MCGAAGTGKSLVLKHIVRALPGDSTFVTASTGLAACALGGTTLHAFAGVGRCSDVASALLKASRLDARQRWNRATTLIVDEVSPPPPPGPGPPRGASSSTCPLGRASVPQAAALSHRSSHVMLYGENAPGGEVILQA